MILFFFCAIIFLNACKNKKQFASVKESPAPPQTSISDTVSNFFPVTSYIKGEIYAIKTGSITPLRTVTVGNKTDTSWIKMNELDSAFSAFLTPVIDTANLKAIFSEKKFLDLTLNAFTFTYDPINERADSFAFKHWDVYVDPETGSVKRVYLVKKESNEIELQLTWQSGKWCKIITIKNMAGKTTIEKEEKISLIY